MDSNRGGVSFNLNKVTYFNIDYSLPATDFQLLMKVQIVQQARVNNLWNGAMITDHHGRIEKKTVHNNKNNNNSSLQCYSVLSDILVKNELCIPLERGSNVLSTGEGFICLSPTSKLKIPVHFCSIYTDPHFQRKIFNENNFN